MKRLPVHIIAALALLSPLRAEPSKPNALFIAIDDLNDQLGCLGAAIPSPRRRTSMPWRKG